MTTVVGTRPEIIRLSRIIPQLDANFEHRLIFSNQNFDPNLSTNFFDELGIRSPNLVMKPLNGSLGDFLGKFMVCLENELDSYPTDALITLGDTNTGLATLIARKKGVPVYHLEAGNRSYDLNVPEELNRKIIDHFSSFNLVYTEHSRQNLLREGLHPRTICLIGSPLNEVLKHYLPQIENSKILVQQNLVRDKYFLVSIHRQENVNNLHRLREIFSSINSIAENFNFPVIVSAHPRTVSKLNEASLKLNKRVALMQPFGYFDYVKLQKEAKLVFSDSGTIGEEAAILGIKAITLRNSIERPEAIEAASIIMSGINRDDVLQAIDNLENSKLTQTVPIDYTIPDSSRRVVNFLMSTRPQFEFWHGIRTTNANEV